VIRQDTMHFLIQHNEISKTHLFVFLPQEKSFYLQAGVIGGAKFCNSGRERVSLITDSDL